MARIRIVKKMGMQFSLNSNAKQHLKGPLPPLPAEPSDESLLQALANGASWAIEPLYDRYSGLLYALASRMVGDHQVAEEVVQDVFLATWQHASSFTPGVGSVRSWLLSLTRHRAIDYLRKKNRRACWQEVSWEAAEWEEEALLPDVWEDVWSSVQRDQVREALLRLPDEQRMAIALAYFRGLTHSEIARRCRIPFGTVKARIRLGLVHLKHALKRIGVGETSVSVKSNRRRVKPGKVATVVVQATGSGCATGYELRRDGACTCFGYTEWELLVEQIEVFEFHGNAGSFKASKARRAHGHTYWYAFQWGSADKKLYLGKSAELTLTRLESMAAKLQMRGQRTNISTSVGYLGTASQLTRASK